MTPLRYTQLGVFGERALDGNALAVVHDAAGLGDDEMARFARWMNLSETTFLLPATDPAADYRVRIFTPTTELPFAGHPTLGSAWAWLAAGGRPRDAGTIVQQCGIGLVRVRRSADPRQLAFAAPARRRSGPLDGALVDRIARILGLPRDEIVGHQHCDNGPGWVAVRLGSAARVRALTPRFGPEDQQLELGVVGPGAPGEATQFEVRAFFPGASGMAEDPVTGSLQAALAQWLIGDGIAPRHYVAAQGSALGRAGRVRVEADDDGDIWIGGHLAPCIEGQVAWR
jgi:PhzF family phenazine biosynthesis protein